MAKRKILNSIVFFSRTESLYYTSNVPDTDNTSSKHESKSWRERRWRWFFLRHAIAVIYMAIYQTDPHLFKCCCGMLGCCCANSFSSSMANWPPTKCFQQETPVENYEEIPLNPTAGICKEWLKQPWEEVFVKPGSREEEKNLLS